MRKQIVLYVLSVLFTGILHGQSNPDSLVNDQMTFELRGDTLHSNTGLKFFAGQKIIIGTAAGAEGYYRSINHNKTALVPSIWGQDSRYPYAIENHVNRKKSREMVKKSLVTGNTLTITGISFSRTAKPHFFSVGLSTDTDKFYCDIKFALMLGELMLPSE